METRKLTEQQQQLVSQNLRLAYWVASRYQGNRHLSREEINQAALYGLCLAARGYDETRGATFSTYAARCAHDAIRKELTRSSYLISAHQARTEDRERFRLRSLPLTARQRDREGIADPACPEVESSSTDYEAMRQHIDRIASRLPPVAQRIITLSLEGKTAQQIGEELGQSTKWVNVQLQAALALLRRHVQVEKNSTARRDVQRLAVPETGRE